MITPMTNIEQSVGRILRQKHEFAPIVVDIIDTHDNFQRQWAKRKSFYKKQNYKIIQINSTIYNPDASKWKLIYEPTSCKSNENISELSNSNDDISSENSETDEETNISEELDTKKDKLSSGVCFLKMKHTNKS